jgi:penicillin-binding protein 2
MKLLGILAGKTLYDKYGQTWYLGNTLSAVIGQAENAFSPIQIAKYITILTNGGKNVDLTLIKAILNKDGTEVPKEEYEAYVNEKLGVPSMEDEGLEIHQENLKAVLEGMRAVANDTGGTAYSTFRDFNIEVGGKTGSAQSGNKSNGWFMGFAPFNDPEVAIVVFVEDAGSGGYTAEVARDIWREYFGMNAVKISENLTVNDYNFNWN